MLTFTITEWMFHEGRFWFSIRKNFPTEHSEGAMGCSREVFKFPVIQGDQTK